MEPQKEGQVTKKGERMREGWIIVKLLLLIFLLSTYGFVIDRSAVVTTEPATKATVLENPHQEELNQIQMEEICVEDSSQEVPKKWTKQEKRVIKKWKEARRENKQTVGWITIPGMEYMDNPIMYAGDNRYYLSHNEKNQTSANGAIFLDASSGGKFGKINLIHGHNLKSGKMFGDLDNYKRKEYVQQHKKITLVQGGEVKQYLVFSVITFDAENEQLETGFPTDEAFQSYYQMLKKRSKFSLPSPETVSSIVILNTCSYEFENAHLLVCGYEKEER